MLLQVLFNFKDSVSRKRVEKQVHGGPWLQRIVNQGITGSKSRLYRIHI